MYDTLARIPVPQYFQGYFAIALRSVGRPWNTTPSAWTEAVLKATFEFVQVLGGLRNILNVICLAFDLLASRIAVSRSAVN